MGCHDCLTFHLRSLSPRCTSAAPQPIGCRLVPLMISSYSGPPHLTTAIAIAKRLRPPACSTSSRNPTNVWSHPTYRIGNHLEVLGSVFQHTLSDPHRARVAWRAHPGVLAYPTSLDCRTDIGHRRLPLYDETKTRPPFPQALPRALLSG